MEEGEGVVVNESFDLNEESVERKRKRISDSIENVKEEGSDDLPNSVGRVLRSRTMAMTDGEKEVINGGIIKNDGTDEDEAAVSPSRKRRKVKGKKRGRGRPPKIRNKEDEDLKIDGIDEDEMAVSPSQKRRKVKGKRGRGRPPKIQNKDDENVKIDGIGKKKRGRGRPPKIENGNVGLKINKKKVGVKNDKVKKVGAPKRKIDHEKIGNGSGVKKQKADSNGVVNDRIAENLVDGNEMGRREQKQMIRDQILAMLYKAGWTVEHRQRQSKDYADAVYVDLDGKTYWSVTLAYKKLKEKIDEGKATDKEISGFNLIPVETLSALFRVTEKGKKAGKKKIGAPVTIKRNTKKESFKKKSLGRKISSKSMVRGKGKTLSARKPVKGSKSDDYELYDGKRSLLSWMIDLEIVPLGGKVRYKKGKNQRTLLEGSIGKDGIICDCCDVEFTIGEFESHAGSTLGKMYQNIYLYSGVSLFECLADSWRKHVEIERIGFVHVDVDGEDPNDDTCNMCADGGNLICCDSCPSTFHNGCLGIKVPSGDWHCVYCSCKFCGIAAETTDEDQGAIESELFTCRSCEEKFHVDCIEGEGAESLDYGDCPSFCSKECLKIFERLQVLGISYELEEGFSYSILQHRDKSLNNDSAHIEINSKLAIAFAVMDECFEPITDERSGSNVIRSVVYNCGSNIRRLNFGGFYTVILEKGDEIVAAATIRVHGSQLAEMPFIGTRYTYRRQGMCRRLLTAVETFLLSLGVEKLVIPAISELNETWTKVFGFCRVDESERLEMKYKSMLVFPGIDMLQKPIMAVESDAALPPDGSAMEVENCLQNKHEEQTKDNGNPLASNFDDTTEVETHNHKKVASVESDVKSGPVCDDESPGQENGVKNLDASKCNGSFLKEATDAKQTSEENGFCVPSVMENCKNEAAEIYMEGNLDKVTAKV